MLQELVNAERMYEQLLSDFKTASVYAVHTIIKKSPPPLNLFNLLGDGADKYIIGGIFLRRAAGWTVCGQQFKTLETFEDAGIIENAINGDLSEIS